MTENQANSNKESPSNRKRVLVVDDNQMERDFLVRILNKGNFEALVPEDWTKKSVKAFLEANPVDLVVTDGLNGYWRDVLDIARGVGAPTVLVSSGGDYIRVAQGMGEKAVPKQAIEDSDDAWFPDWLMKNVFAGKP